ncbi:unnamed protein product [Nippostrongylus brasiliensis]|uniref:RNA-directed DNA polymerase n=1 Tax=Nippostrongylus brasiliensis TaxID=27835 RepID=A0A0N4YQ19_NIPBR|nr:unnamed protein product [Nippostrongylus brasiliensis]
MSSSTLHSSGADVPLSEPDGSSSDPGLIIPLSEPVHGETLGGQVSAPLVEPLSALEDPASPKAKDFKALREATSLAITQVWSDSVSRTSALEEKIKEGNMSFAHKLDESVSAVDARIQQLPIVAMLGQDSSSGPRVAPSSGSSDEGMQFSVWLRRLEDIIRMRPGVISSEQKANFLIGHLDGVARDKVEELSEEDRKDFALVAGHLKSFFESPQQRYVARQKLAVCRQEPGESSSAFANKVLNLVRAATAGQDPQIQKDRTLEEFVARLRNDVRYFVKLDNPASFEQAVSKAQMVEQLLTEAAADRLMHPGSVGEAQARALERAPVERAARGSGGRNETLFRGTTRVPNNNQRRSIEVPRQRQQNRGEQLRGIHCFNCGGLGHLASHCPSPSSNNRRMSREVGQSFPSRANNRRSFNPSRGGAKLMSCDPSLRSASDTEDLLRSAHQRIPELSIEVGRTKVELDNSQARLAAISQRNDELAQVGTALDPVFSPKALDRDTNSPLTAALGMAGIPVAFVGTAMVDLVIGGEGLRHQVHFTATQCVPTSPSSYNIILGNDLLARLPRWSIDYKRCIFHVGRESVPIRTSVACDSRPDLLFEYTPTMGLVVRAASTTVVPAGTEVLVRCYVARDAPELGRSPALCSRAQVWGDGSVFVAPVVFHDRSAWLSVANSSSAPFVIRKDERLTDADPLLEQDNGNLIDSDKIFSDTCSPFFVDLSQADVTEDEKRQLEDLFREFQDRISQSTYDLGSYEVSPISIKTTTEVPPIRYRPVRIPTRFQKELDEHIQKLLKTGRIVESDTPWVHNTVLVKKRDGSLRVCLDFRPLNEVTIPDHFPLPRIEDLLEKVSGNRYYTTLDLASGYMQLLLDKESQAKCGWATHKGIYQFVYLPFGLRNAGAYFSRAMARILAGLEDNCLAYLDDIIIFDKDFPSHLQSLRRVFERFRIFNIKASGKKLTSIAQSKITFLGHEISFDAYRPAERNTKAIKELPRPTTVKDVKTFIGMANFFRKFIRNFASIAAPLYDLCKDKSSFEWTPEREEAFLAIKEALVSRPCLAFPRNCEFILHTDGSKTAVGAALLQEQADSKKLAAVGYFSKTLSESQKKWAPVQIELFAMIAALRFFRTTIYGQLTRVLSDHKPITFLLKHHKTHDNLARWVIELQSYNIKIEYLRGSSNVLADCLSRLTNTEDRFVDDTPETDDIVEFPVCLVGHPTQIRPYDILLEQKQDPFCSALMHFLETGSFPAQTSEEIKAKALDLADSSILRKNGCLYKISQQGSQPNSRNQALFLPEKLREPVCIAFHASPSAGGHFGWKKTLAKVARKYFWPTMREDIYNFARSCEVCQRKRGHQPNREFLLPISANAIFHKVYLDLSGPYHSTASSNKYVLCMIDHFSKYVIAAALPDCTAVTVARSIMSECILKYGAMSALISDNASYLKGELLTELGRLLRVHRYFCTPYHHEGNGLCERVFATFQSMLRTYIGDNHLDWDQFLPACHIPSDDDASIYKASLLSALHSAWTAAAEFNAKRRKAYKRQYDKSGFSPISISVGDRVFLRNFVPPAGPVFSSPWEPIEESSALSDNGASSIEITGYDHDVPPEEDNVNLIASCEFPL